ncbi:hypothetical protein EVAR_88389_1 [Eumeta japonica]|uniref:Uncharacterized protein n=1 Tax=Eumeta variegata TaxID=151549 RepID=A0A4C1XC41_EUMVA|nr:hypothetical protein EVAR_88389_1 [Eumeta japonica]
MFFLMGSMQRAEDFAARAHAREYVRAFRTMLVADRRMGRIGIITPVPVRAHTSGHGPLAACSFIALRLYT